MIPQLASAGAAIGTLVAEGVVWIVQFIALRKEVIPAYRNVRYGAVILATFVGANTCTYIHLCVVAKFRYILNILYPFLDKSRTDTAENIVKEETFGSPGLFENRSEHKNGKHIKENVAESCMILICAM